jgi:hypothetical protein
MVNPIDAALVAVRAGDEGRAEAQRRIERALGYARAI